MNITGINPFDKKKKVKVFGERNSATIYIEWLLKKNFKVELLDYKSFGWKHRLAPTKSELEMHAHDDVCFICIVKNPYSWLRSMHRRPYKQEELKNMKFSEFLKFPYGDYENPVKMWNKKNKSYLELSENVRNFHMLKYEDLLVNPEKLLEQIQQKMRLSKSVFWFTDMEQKLSNKKGVSSNRFHKKYYLKEKWKDQYAAEDIAFINSQLDEELMQNFNYEILELSVYDNSMT